MNRLNWFGKIKAEGGMTMLEVTFASVTLLGAIIIMMSMFDTSISILSFTTTRSIATQIATEEIENIRSMDYEQVNNKIPTSWPNDPDLSTTSTPVKYRDVNDAGQELWRDVNTTASIGLDMERMVIRKNTKFTIRNYVLWADDSTATHAYKRLVVKVSWPAPGTPGEVVLTSDFAKTDTSEPRPAVTIVGIRSTNYNYFKGANEDATMSVDDSIRGPISGEASTPVVYARAQASSAKATGITKVVYTLIEPDGDAYTPVTVTTTDSQGYWPWSLNTMSPRIPDNTGYMIKAEAFDSLGHSDITALRINIDNTPPPIVSSFETVDVANFPAAAYMIQLNWNWAPSPTDTVPSISRFFIKRRKGSETSLAPRLSVPENYRQFVDTLASSGKYVYSVTTVDTAGNLGVRGNEPERERLKTLVDTQTPLPVTTMTVEAISWKSVYLDWDSVTDLPDPGGTGIAGYFIRASDNQLDWILVGETTLGVSGVPTEYRDPGLKPDKQYWYVFKAFDGEGNQSASSTPISARTPLR